MYTFFNRLTTGLKSYRRLVTMLLTQNVSHWSDTLKSIHVPGHEISICCLATTAIQISLGDAAASVILPALMNVFGLGNATTSFATQHYIPEAQKLRFQQAHDM